MSSKKLRLDVDSMLEASGSSTSSPFRGKYTRPLGGGSMTGGSRYSPYSISRDRPSARRSVPLIRATRDEEGGGTSSSSSSVDLNTSTGFGGTSSSTAQKIIETLASMSTPVLNAGRVRIDSIKTMKPMSLGSVVENRGSMLTPTSKFSGPPKTSSPLMLPKSLTGVRGTSLGTDFNWSQRSIGMQPKMIDSGTNTEESFIDTEKKGQAQSPPTPTQVVSIVANNATSIQPEKENGLRHSAVKRKFNFSEPWSLKDLEKLGRRSKEEIPEAMNDDESSSSSSSDDDEDLSNDAATQVIAARPNGEVTKQEKTKEPELGSLKFAPILMTSSGSEKQWKCSECWVMNKPSDLNCVSCTTPNPNPTVPDKSTQDKTDSGIKLTTVPKKWKCPTCDVPNEPTAKACVCCSEKNPNPVDSGPTESTTAVSVTASSGVPASTFKFGFANSGAAATSSPSVSSGFSFGSSSQPVASTESTKSFSFGFQSSSSTTTTSIATKTQSSPSPAGFSFGAPSTAIKPVASASPIKFGFNTSTEETKKSEVPPTKKIELWECDVCKHKVKFELHSCEICGSPRPQELDPHYKKAAEKPKAELKFDPIFGGGLKSASSGTPSSGFSSPAATTSASGGGFGSSTFGSGGSTFSSGNPFGGGGGTFGGSGTFSTAGGIGSGSTFGNAVQSTPPTTATNTAGLFSGVSAAPPSFSTPAGGNSSQGFQFGSTSPSPSKRKLEEGIEGDPAKKIATSGVANFTFGGTSNIPALKLKETPTPQFPVPPASAAPPNNNAGFLEALKNASAAVKASSEKQSNTVTSTSGPAANKTFTFGNPAPAPVAPVAPAAAGGFFNNPNSSGFANTFGNPAGGTFSSPSMGVNHINPPPAVTPVARAPAQFNMTPSFNFGAPAAPASTFNFGSNPSTGAAGGAAAAPFQFAATPSAAGPAIGDRKIRKAARRFK